MSKFGRALFLIAIFGLGCAASRIVTPEASAQTNEVGPAAAPAAGQSTAGQFGECFSVSLWGIAGGKLNNGEWPTKTVKVPRGWRVVGGAGTQAEPHMILCR